MFFFIHMAVDLGYYTFIQFNFIYEFIGNYTMQQSDSSWFDKSWCNINKKIIQIPNDLYHLIHSNFLVSIFLYSLKWME